MEKTKLEYIRLMCQMKMTGAICKQFNGSGALQGFNQADCSKFLQFITGTSKVPLQSFAALEGMNGIQKFQIHREDKLTDRLSFAHICFNQLDLPVYETYDKL
ncbi:E3 ubiquitin-protein ligase HUWE1-like isoform X2 [Solenopsis invicta]|uniref:E3 ubiquitin-protein ligase HUWE1-like isoform X2 n=1 Tax=Solenopsis invicta TaxID=13686 RepID=UPI00193D7FA0|nr:E3 ubiquitin-protein ligase HUWE1-like isoform X2 [Solenopsis invicta]XP_039305614.1 E3 ubiquitin-protein ligase HUWE1 isoform X2 [Solenopsis invicta]XP_039306622.1 E3 ubiquitin-protein ligase HUWE1-like isoform X3 [Solenopsis invicta]XP_039312776.1 E3 ubiquitin-protein ligase HUWE1-like isoform X2 [Solenopsis invicta]